MKEINRLEGIKNRMDIKYSNKNYDDIINLPHHVSTKHPRMSLEARSAQFAPFAALTGYEDAIEETGRLTTEKIDIDDEIKSKINKKIQLIKSNLLKHNKVSIKYFIPDTKKEGGCYKIVSGVIKKIDEYKQIIIMEDKTEISVNEIIDISGDIFTLIE